MQTQRWSFALASALVLSVGSLAASPVEKPAEKAVKADAKKDAKSKKAVAGGKVAIDPTASALKWQGKKVTGQHDGAVKIKEGELVLDGGNLKGGNFTIDMNSISVRDIEDPKSNAKLTGHLKSPDFFDVAKYPTSKLVIKDVKSVEGIAGPTFEVTADLTIKDKTNEVKFPAVVETKDGKTTAKANVTVDRTKFDVRYGSGKFFQGLGDKMIDDNFQLDIALASK